MKLKDVLTEVTRKETMDKAAARGRIVVNMRDNKGMTFKQIGTELGVGPETARQLYYAAIRRAHDRMERARAKEKLDWDQVVGPS